MLDKFENKYRIPSARWQNWDYRTNAAYFITICTKKNAHYFGEINDAAMKLSNVGVLADVFWHEIKNHANNVILDSFTVMPNHIHGIIILENHEQLTNSATIVETRHALSESTNLLKSTGSIGDETIDTETIHMETRHALSESTNLLKSTGSIGDETIDTETIHMETRHAVSLPLILQQPNETPKTIGQKRFQNQGKNSISAIIGSYKAAVTKHANRLGYEFGWQTRFHDHVIRDAETYQRIANYIDSNALNWKDDEFYG
jgi:REP element-mobilizing transposase RayT